jgi:DNA-nicking Smr family endonuclease
MTRDLLRDMADLARMVSKGDEARERLAHVIVEATRDGVRQVDIVRATGYSRERIRQIVRASETSAPRTD